MTFSSIMQVLNKTVVNIISFRHTSLVYRTLQMTGHKQHRTFLLAVISFPQRNEILMQYFSSITNFQFNVAIARLQAEHIVGRNNIDGCGADRRIVFKSRGVSSLLRWLRI